MAKIDKALARRVERALQAAIKAAETDGAFTAAQTALKQQSIDVLRVLAEAAVVDAIRRAQRAKTLDAELDAMQSSQPPKRPRRGTRAYAEWVDSTEEGRAWEADVLNDQARSDSDLFAVISDALETYSSQLQMKWTAELLASGFALPDGSVVSWGEATVTQHEARVSMFAVNARANIEGAARHAAAISELKQANRDTLNELVMESAA